jgi:hypothetical protein
MVGVEDLFDFSGAESGLNLGDHVAGDVAARSPQHQQLPGVNDA